MKWRKMALAFRREAQSDLHIAEVLLAEQEFARSVEKNFPEHPAIKEIVNKAHALENEGTLTEYPAWDPVTGSVVSPYEKYDQNTAQKFYDDAHWIFHQIALYLKHAFQISLSDS